MLKFFFIATVFSWGLWAAFGASQAGRLPFRIPVEFTLLGEYGPAFAAFVMLALSRGKRGVLDLLRSLSKWKVDAKWYLFVLSITPAAMLVTIAITALLGGSLPDTGALAQWPETFRARTSAFAPSMGLVSGLVDFMSTGTWATTVGMIVLGVAQGGLSEEPGWRGYAMAEGMKRWNLLVTALVVGAMWAAWHMSGPPHFQVLFEKGFMPWLTISAGSIFEYLLLCLPLAVLYAWVYANTGSVLLSVILHAAYNITITVLVPAWPNWAALTFIAVLWVIAALVIVFARKQFFSRAGAASEGASALAAT